MFYVLEPHNSFEGRTRFRVGMISHSVSYVHRLNFYQVTYQTWRIPGTEKPSKLQSMGSQELDTT